MMTKCDDADWHGQEFADSIGSAKARIPLENCVCIGLGGIGIKTISDDKETKVHRHIMTSLNQLAAIEKWVRALEERFGRDHIRILPYDPCYKAADVEFLRGRGHTVPEILSDGSLHLVNENTLLFAPYCTWIGVIDHLIKAEAMPAIFVGCDIEQQLEIMPLWPPER